MANRFNEEYREPHNGADVMGNYDLSPGDQQQFEWLKSQQNNTSLPVSPWAEVRGAGFKYPQNPHGPTNPPEPTGGVRVPRTPFPFRPAGGMSRPIPTKAGTW